MPTMATRRQIQSFPLVVVITPVHNGDPFLAQTLECVQLQNYPHLIHVVFDNASNDGTADLIASAGPGRVPILTRRSDILLPQRDSWNAALSMIPTAAKYFRLLAADDLMSPSAISKMVEVGESDSSIGIVGCLEAIGNEPENVRCVQGVELPRYKAMYEGRWIVKSHLMRLHRGMSCMHALVRTTFLRDNTPFYTEQTGFDMDACIRTLLKCNYGFVHDEIAFTRLHSGSVTSMQSTAVQLFISEWLLWLDKYGPSVMTSQELKACQQAHLNHYFRRLLLWRYRDRNEELVKHHLALLDKRYSIRPKASDYIVALADWVWLAARGNRSDVGVAAKQRERVWQELLEGPVQFS